MSKQASQYDKIFKENIEAVIPNLMQNILGITAISSDSQSNTFVLHLEIQLIDEPEMVFRMAEYHIILARKYKQPVRQYVLFLGTSAPKMPVRYESELMNFTFPLIVFSALDYQIFLQSNQPEEVVLGVLANFKGESPETVLHQIIQRVEETAVGDLALKRYFSQLRILAQLRNLEQTLRDLAMDSIAKFVSIEKDAAYMVGFDKGEEKVVASLLKKLNYSLEQIADIAGVSVEFVKNVKQKISTDK